MDKHDKDEILSAIATVGAKVDALSVKVDRIDGDVRELRGQMTVLQSWLSSMDQRFIAIMTPYQPDGRKKA